MKQTPRQLNRATTMATSLATLLIISLSSCANISTLSTNLDRANFRDYFAPHQVTVFAREQDFDSKYRFVGLVEGHSCQEKPHHALPDEVNARTDARRQAFNQQANAVIFSQCVVIKDDNVGKRCVATTVCYGRAYQLEGKR